MVQSSVYTSGEYLRRNPSWHVEDSLWKAQRIIKMLRTNGIVPNTLCEVGCGAGEILKQLQELLPHESTLWGYEISPQAFEMCQTKANERLHFVLGDFREAQHVNFDLILVIDLLEHLEDCFGFLRDIKPRSHYKIFHIPLDISVQTVLRAKPLIDLRTSVGHIHYFSKETALETLRHVGYEVLDYFYTRIDKSPATSIKARGGNLVRKILFKLHKDLAVRLTGRYSLMVLAR